MWKYYALRLAELLIAPLPSRLGHLIANFFGDSAYFFGRASRAHVKENLRHVLGDEVDEKTLRRLAREAFRNLSRNYYDLIRVPRLSPEKLNGRVEFVGLEHLEQARQGGRGAVVTTAHLGNADLVTQATLAISVPLTILVERIQPDKLWEHWMRLRGTQGMSFEPAGSQGLKAAYRALRRGEVVGIACDRAIHGEGITTTFMGKPAVLPVGAVELALRTGAALVPAFSTRTGRDRYRISIEPAIPVVSNGHRRPTEEDMSRVVGQVIAVMERHIRRSPEQWMLFKPVWRGDNSA